MSAHQHGHGHGHGHDGVDESAMFTRQFWDDRYASSTRIWSGSPNQRLVEQISGLAPGRAVDIGCGEGADVVWLAKQGWEVVGVDVSQVALDRAAGHAADEGVADRTSFVLVDLLGGDELPGDMDLVTSHYMHTPMDEFARTYAAMGAAVRPGGTLLVVGHHPLDAETGLRNDRLSHLLFGQQQVVDALDPTEWDILVSEAQPRQTTGRDGEAVTITDTVVRARRR